MGGIYNPPTPQSIGAVPITRELVAGANITIDGGASGALDEDLTIAATGGGGGDYTLIDRQILGVAATTVTFAAIPDTFEDLIICINGRGSQAAATIKPQLQFNNDVGANYYSLSENRFGVSSSLAGTSIVGSEMVAANAPANVATEVEILIASYARTVFQKSAILKSNLRGGVTAADLIIVNSIGFWLNTAAISEIDIVASAGNFVANSVFSLYGRN